MDIQLAKIEILIEQRRFDEAEKKIGELLNLDPNNVELLLTLAEIKLEQDEYHETHSLLKSIAALSPGNPALFYVNARLAAAEIRFDDAEHNIAQAIKIAPHDADFFAFMLKLNYSVNNLVKPLN